MRAVREETLSRRRMRDYIIMYTFQFRPSPGAKNYYAIAAVGLGPVHDFTYTIIL